MEEFEKIIKISPPYDKRSADPSKNYGIGGMTITFILKGALGATQFTFYTGQYQKHTADELWRKDELKHNPFKGMGADIGCHSRKPSYEGQNSTDEDCDLVGGKCFYDGSSLQASEFEDEFLTNGEPAVWKMLEERYNMWLTPSPNH